MTINTFDPSSLIETCKDAFAPVLRAQQEGIKTLETFARHQYGVAGDYLNWSIAQAKAAVDAKSPTEFFTRQAELTGEFGEQLRTRGQELVKLATDAQGSFKQFVTEATAKATEATEATAKSTKKAA